VKERVEVAEERQYTNHCACGWEVTGPEDEVVDATIDHGKRIHNMEATREQVLAVLHARADAAPDVAGRPGAGAA
jgi:predicted small metal-binding protein